MLWIKFIYPYPVSGLLGNDSDGNDGFYDGMQIPKAAMALFEIALYQWSNGLTVQISNIHPDLVCQF